MRPYCTWNRADKGFNAILYSALCQISCMILSDTLVGMPALSSIRAAASTLGVCDPSSSPTRVSEAITVTSTLPGCGMTAPKIAMPPIILSLPTMPARVSTLLSPFCMDITIVFGPTKGITSRAALAVSKDLTVMNTMS